MALCFRVHEHLPLTPIMSSTGPKLILSVKGAHSDSRHALARCTLCGKPETQAHINTTCTHPALQDLRQLHRRRIELNFLALRYAALTLIQQWTRTLLTYMEQHIWEDTELVCDLWNGRWSHHAFSIILGDKGQEIVSRKTFIGGIRKLTTITKLLQTAQRELYSTRRLILKAEQNQLPIISISRRRKRYRSSRSLTLPEVWNLPYTRPNVTQKHPTPSTEDLSPRIPHPAPGPPRRSSFSHRPSSPIDTATQTLLSAKGSSHNPTQILQIELSLIAASQLLPIERMVRYACLFLAQSIGVS
jgi:hypothetical protein